MPFIMIDDSDTSENGFDEIFVDVSPAELGRLILAGVSEQLGKLVNEALRPHLYALTGNVDYLPETTSEQPRKKK